MEVSCDLLKGQIIEVSPQSQGFEGAWFRAMVESYKRRPGRRNNIRIRYLDLTTEFWSPLCKTTSKKFIRSIQPENLFSTDEFEEGSVVEAAHRDGWWVGLFVRKLEDDKYLIYFESPPDLLCFKRKQLRQHFQRSDGKWVRPRNKQMSQFKSGLSCGSVVEIQEEREWIKAMIVEEMKGGDTFLVRDCKYLVSNDENTPKRIVHLSKIRCLPFPTESLEFLSRQALRNKVGCSAMDAKEDVPLVTPSLSIASTQQNTTLVPKRLQIGSGKRSTRENEDNNGKRKRQENITSVGNDEETRAKKTPMVLPFDKKLPIWKAVESMEVFKQVPQTPHFKLLVETQEDSREMSAVGMMFTYSALLEEVKTLQLDTPLCTVIGLSNSFVMLEKHGFDIKEPKARIQKLLSLRDKQVKKMEERNSVEKRIAEKESEKAENKRKFLELQRLDEEVDKEIAQMKLNAAMIDQELNDMQLQFQSTF